MLKLLLHCSHVSNSLAPMLQEQQGKDEVTLNEANLEKPEKPKPATVDDGRQRIIEKYNNIRRLPGLWPCST